MLAQESKTAPTWDSFSDTLYKVLDEIKPQRIFEWGPGVSTTIMALHPEVKSIDTVESDNEWYQRALLNKVADTQVYFEQDLEKYPYVKGRHEKYDLVFIDGREREKCLDVTHSLLLDKGVVVLHDAERPSYLPHIRTYRYIHFTDNGHTVVLTNDPMTSYRLDKVL